MRSIPAGAMVLLATVAHGALKDEQSHWSLFALGGYSVAFPAGPTELTDPTLPKGFRSWSATGASVPYVFTLSNVKDEDAKLPADVVLGQCVAGLLSSRKGTITGERDLLLEGWPGVEIHYSQETGVLGIMRAYLVKGKVVTLMVTHAIGTAEPEGLTKYFGSVKLPSDIPKGTLTAAGPVLEKYELDSSGFTAKVPQGARSGTSTIGAPDAAVQMHRFATAYLNRVYMGIVIDPPAAAKKDLDSDTTGKPAQAVNAFLAGQFNATVSKTDSKDTPLGKDWTATFTLGHGLVGRLETYIRNNHTYSLLAIVPDSMMASDEAKGFFDSVTLPEKK